MDSSRTSKDLVARLRDWYHDEDSGLGDAALLMGEAAALIERHFVDDGSGKWGSPATPPGPSDRQRLEHYWKFCNVLTHPSYMDFQDWLKSLDEDKAERCPSETKGGEQS